jgi:hypothetical protein
MNSTRGNPDETRLEARVKTSKSETLLDLTKQLLRK